MKLEELEKRFHIAQEDCILALGLLAEEVMPKLIKVAKAAKDLMHSNKFLDNAYECALQSAIEELEKDR